MMQFQMQQQTLASQQVQNQSRVITIIFRRDPHEQPSPPTMIQCMPEDKVSDMIEKYRIKSGDRDTTKKFIFNAHALNPSLKLIEAGITNNANVFVVVTKGIKGG